MLHRFSLNPICICNAYAGLEINLLNITIVQPEVNKEEGINLAGCTFKIITLNTVNYCFGAKCIVLQCSAQITFRDTNGRKLVLESYHVFVNMLQFSLRNRILCY